jgi:RHS repeat-associated protein
VSANPGTSGILTTYTYTFHDTADTQIQKRTTSFPAISSGENGSGVSTSWEQYFDDLGRLRWTKDGEGYVNYYSYHPNTGGLAYVMVDVNTSSLSSEITSGSSGKWIAWSGSAGLTRGPSLPAALQLVTKDEYDTQGRPTLTIDSRGFKHYIVYEENNGNRRTLFFPYWKATGRLMPIRAVKNDDAGRLLEIFDIDPAEGNGDPPTALSSPAQSDYVAWTKYAYKALTGQLDTIDRYHSIPGSGPGAMSTNFYRKVFRYDSMGRREYVVEVVSGTATSDSREQVTQFAYDKLNRITEIKLGVSPDSAGSNHDLTVNYSAFSTMTFAKSEAYVYDFGGVDDGYLTTIKRYFGTGANDFTGVNYWWDFRGHLRGEEPFYMNGSTETKIAPFTVHDVVDWRGSRTASAMYTTNQTWNGVVIDDDYAATISTNRRTLKRTFYDDLNRPYEFRTYSVSSGGTATNYLESDVYYDRNNRLVAVAPAHAAAAEFAYDGAGRLYQTRTVSQLQSGKYDTMTGIFQYRAPVPKPKIPNAGDMGSEYMSGGDNLMYSMIHLAFDNAGNETERHQLETTHNDSPIGLDVSSHDDYVRRTIYSWYDDADRVTTVADYGSGDSTTGLWKYASIPARPGTAPSTSTADYLVTLFAYDSKDGRLQSVADPNAKVRKFFYDHLGRITLLSANHDNFIPPDQNTGDDAMPTPDYSKDQVTEWQYNGLDQVAKLIVRRQPGTTDDQTTKYLYENAVDASWATNEIYPDSSDSTSGGTDQVKYVFNVDGSVSRRTDQRGTILDYVYNGRRQLELTKVFALGGADNAIESIKRSYDSLGRLEFITSYDANTGSGTVLNEVQLAYNDMGQVATSYQSHQGVVNTGTSPNVQYSYDTTVSGNVFSRQHRLQQITHPNGRTAVYDYDTTNIDRVNNRLSLPRSLWSGGTQRVVYDHSGAGRLAIVDYVVPDVKLDYYQAGSGTTYNGLDRFARVKDQFWDAYQTTADVSRVQHGYDYASNRKWREDIIAANNSKDHDELYTYDGLHRLTDADRGNLDGSHTSISSKNFAHEWGLDALGNWSAFKEDNDTDATWELDQTRSHNKANELSTASSWSTSGHDTRGNMTTAPDPTNLSNSLFLTYDAWNRLVKVANQGLQILAEYEYDGLNRRIVKIDRVPATDVTYDYYYNQGWQTLEVRKGGVPTPLEQFVWHPYYIDAPALRVYDADTSGGGAPVDHYYAHDANFNVAAVFGNTGTVLERYQYTGYGNLKVLDANFADDADGKTDIGNLITYTGREYDAETGLFHYRHRYYHAQLGRFLSRDPIGYLGGINMYAYVNGSPVTMVCFGSAGTGMSLVEY